MRINESSWHYRVLKWMGSSYGKRWNPPNSLCSYFWSFPGYLIRLIYISAVTAGMISYLPVSLYFWLYNGSYVGKVIVLVTLAFLLFLFSAMSIDVIKDTVNNNEDSFVRLFFSWIKTRKRRVCPLIIYVSPKDSAK